MTTERTRHARPGPRAEDLEARRLLAATIEDRVLIGRGTAGNDVITVDRVGMDDVVVTINGARRTFDMDDFDIVSLYGGAGDDRITTAPETGRVEAYGDTGNDILTRGDDDDSVFGGPGVDAVYWWGSDWVSIVGTGTSGPDVISVDRVGVDDIVVTVNGVGETFDMDNFIGYSVVSLYGAGGNDRISIAPGVGPVQAYGQAGDDILTRGDADDSLFGGPGVDTFYRAGEAQPFISLTSGVITVPGTAAGDEFFARGDNEYEITVGIKDGDGSVSEDAFDIAGITDVRLMGLGGNDQFRLTDFVPLPGGWPATPLVTADGGPGNDRMVVGEHVKESLIGGDGNDFVDYVFADYSTPGSPPPFHGGPGIDSVNLGNRWSTAFTYTLPPTVEHASLGRGILIGNALPNRLALEIGFGGGIRGGGGDDTLIGSEYEESLLGEEGNDTLIGGPGDDILDGGPGTDTLSGGFGSDVFLNGEVVPRPSIRIANRILIADGSWDAERITIEPTGFDNVIVRVEEVARQFDMDDFDGVLLRGNNGYDSLQVLDLIVAGGRVRQVTLEGGNGNDTLEGFNDSDDVLRGGAGNDSLFGVPSWDFGGVGNDVLDGGDGDDFMHALDGAGGDTILGGSGVNTAFFDEGDIVIDALHPDDNGHD